MRISFIGAGRVATHLAQVLQKQHEIVQILSRDLAHASNLADLVNADPSNDFKTLNPSIDLLIIAVSDQAITEVIKHVSRLLPDVLIVHTSGSTALNVLTQHHARAGVLYPLQTFSIERSIDWQTTPLFVEAVEEQDLSILRILAQGLSSRVYCYDSEQRLSLHLAAVFACNFSNYCYDMAKQILDTKSVDFNLLSPLILETAQKAIKNEPSTMQTGPAMRGDSVILKMHAQMLTDTQRHDLKAIYELMSEQIATRHNQNIS